MANLYNNKVVINNETIIDLSNDTVTESDVAEGKTFHDASGAEKTGTKTEPKLQSKSVTYTSNGTATVRPDSGYNGLSSVYVSVNVSAVAEKCTIVLSHGTNRSTPILYAYQSVGLNGQVDTKVGTLRKNASVTLSDVACGSLFAVAGWQNEYFDVSSNITGINSGQYQSTYDDTSIMCAITPKTAGAQGTIRVKYK